MLSVLKYKKILISVLVATVYGCGGGGGGGPSNVTSGDSATATSIAEGYQALSAGSFDSFNNSLTLSSLVDKIINAIRTRNWDFISTAYASGSCSAAASKLIGAKSATEWKELSLRHLDTNSESNVDDSSDSECITGIQDSANYIAFSSDNLSNNNGRKCEINLLRKSDSKVYCINTDIPQLLNISNSTAHASYEIGVKQTSNNNGIEHQGDYSINSGGV
jgi:hypothetical protein